MESSINQQESKENLPRDEEEELITDFSQLFKGKMPARRPSKPVVRVQDTPNWLLEIPTKLELTREQLAERKLIDQRKWKSITKGSNPGQRLLAAITSIWNYLFSTKGVGQMTPLTLKEVEDLLKLRQIKYDTNDAAEQTSVLQVSFKILCEEYKILGNCQIRQGLLEKQGVTALLKQISNPKSFHVLLTYQNVILPLGFDNTPLVPIDAYKPLHQISPENLQLWIVSGSTSRFDSPLVSKRWSDITKCMTTQWPSYIDLQQPKKGPQRYPEATPQNQNEVRKNPFCIIEFTASPNNQ